MTVMTEHPEYANGTQNGRWEEMNRVLSLIDSRVVTLVKQRADELNEEKPVRSWVKGMEDLIEELRELREEVLGA